MYARAGAQLDRARRSGRRRRGRGDELVWRFRELVRPPRRLDRLLPGARRHACRSTSTSACQLLKLGEEARVPLADFTLAGRRAPQAAPLVREGRRSGLHLRDRPRRRRAGAAARARARLRRVARARERRARRASRSASFDARLPRAPPGRGRAPRRNDRRLRQPLAATPRTRRPAPTGMNEELSIDLMRQREPRPTA